MNPARIVDENLRKRLEQCNTLPSLPAVAARIVELSRDPDASMKDVADTVTSDPALAAKVLRTANSPMYARQRKCESFQQALVLLGLNATLTLALTFSLVTRANANPREGLDYERVWRRALLSATAARVVADHLGARAPEDAFLAGLLQDIGMLALDQACPSVYADLRDAQQDHLEVLRYEKERIGCDHAAVGAWLLERWGVDERLRYAVAGSHDPAGQCESLGANVRLLTHAVALSGPIADLWMTAAPETSVNALRIAVDQDAGMDGETMSKLVEAVAIAVPEVEALFEMKVVDPARSEWIMNDAREVIALRNIQMMEESMRLQQVTNTLQAQARVLEEKSRIDNLTGTYNRGHLDKILSEWFADAQRTSMPLSLVFIDLDDFKLINDRHGHQLGDQVLVRVSQALLELARASDLVARYGGEEFVMLLPGCDAGGAKRYCNRLLDVFREMEYRAEDGNAMSVTVSMGVATHGEHTHFNTCDELLRSADRALYRAKQTGKNRFVEHGVTSHAA